MGVKRESQLVAGHCGDVVKTRLENIALGCEQLHLRVEDIELGSRAGIEALFGEPESLGRLHDACRLAVDGFLRLLEVGNCLLDIEHDLADSVVVVVLRLHELGLGLRHAAIGRAAIPNVPCAGGPEEPSAHRVREILRSEVIRKFIAGICVDAGKPTGDLHIHVGGELKDRLALGLERRITGNRNSDGVVRIDLARAVTERADDIEWHLAGIALRIVHAKKPDELVGGDTVSVLSLNERRHGIGKRNFGLEDVETRHGAGLVAVLLVFDLLLEQRDILLLGDDQRPVEDDLIELINDLRDYVVDDRAQAEKGAVVGRAPRLDAGNGRAAVENELGRLKLNVPRLVLDGAALAAAK